MRRVAYAMTNVTCST